MNVTGKLKGHCGREGLKDSLRAALESAGLGQKPSPADLAPLDQFHIRGLAAMVELADAAKIRRSEPVIEIGSGLGGPSRYFAATLGCRAPRPTVPALRSPAGWQPNS